MSRTYREIKLEEARMEIRDLLEGDVLPEARDDLEDIVTNIENIYVKALGY